VALAAFKQDKTIRLLLSYFKVHLTMIAKWKSQLLDRVGEMFRYGCKCVKNDN
jgi:hypothetical protein